MPTKFKRSKRVLDLGALGFITALDLSPQGGNRPTCTYIGGLPYALPPTGQFRFRPPRPLPRGFHYGPHNNPGSYVGSAALCPQPTHLKKPDLSLVDEDCLQLNIWIPSGAKPKDGWPVFFYIHGGWLQFGTANLGPDVVANLMHETPFKAVVVAPAYRLNLFGFLAGRELESEAQNNGETVGNMGFWDQRTALEWVKWNANVLDIDPTKITVAGYSAGAHSTFQQLAHDLDRPEDERCIGRVIMWSNGPGVQAKSLPEHHEQFEELLSRLGIDLKLSGEERLRRLRGLPVQKLVDVQSKMTISEFRALNDSAFISERVHQSINDGTFAQKCKARNIKILNGECSEEWYMYGSWRAPGDSYDKVYTRMVADYPERTVKILMPLYFPNKSLPSEYKDWRDAFGKIYADMQVYALERGFASKLNENGFKAGQDLLRYRVEWRAKCVQLPPEWGVTHSSDIAIWFWGYGWGHGLTKKEKKMLAPLNSIFASFVNFEDVQWSVKDPRKQLYLDSKGRLDMTDDTRFDHGVKLWQALTTEQSPAAKL
ncbi:alpha/beta-hydrolase [Myriangium duriaei CBS 260.36]|uniref:Alpha/beta-hydrolase n=1 Tax=Myriangium duriaei CBS 260.36 TaxID=1168546 RepID=A0A9P4JA49_9PEZI|nr:alpha/beta-hydrolase [Myriangium duriaei CBS 260.36]